MKKGFTLLELLIVIIIVGVLATIGFTQYTAVVERSRGAEARQILGQLRSICAGMYMAIANVSNCDVNNLSIGTDSDKIPSSCTGRTSHYFYYNVTRTPPGNVTFNASRCSSGGKPPVGVAGRYISLTTDYAAGGSDDWNTNYGY